MKQPDRLISLLEVIIQTPSECPSEHLTMKTETGKALQQANFYKQQLKGVIGLAKAIRKLAKETKP